MVVERKGEIASFYVNKFCRAEYNLFQGEKGS